MATLPADFDFTRPLARSAAQNLIDLYGFPDPEARWPGRQMRSTARPTVALLGDDPGNVDGRGGPTAWRCAPLVGRWCHAAIIHASGGEPEHYAEAVRGALQFGRLALIETTSRHAQAWAECLACPTTLLILPNDGPHPIDRVLH